jgi:predicted RNA binding protein YcfA (HicA-like mRNA interferase family)
LFLTSQQLAKKLRKAGCLKIREGGNHEIWRNPATNKNFTVSRGGIKSKRLAADLQKQSGAKLT